MLGWSIPASPHINIDSGKSMATSGNILVAFTVSIKWNCTIQCFKYHFVRGTIHAILKPNIQK